MSGRFLKLRLDDPSTEPLRARIAALQAECTALERYGLGQQEERQYQERIAALEAENAELRQRLLEGRFAPNNRIVPDKIPPGLTLERIAENERLRLVYEYECIWQEGRDDGYNSEVLFILGNFRQAVNNTDPYFKARGTENERLRVAYDVVCARAQKDQAFSAERAMLELRQALEGKRDG